MAAYQIIGFNKASGSLVVSFDEKMAPLGIDIPFDEQGNYITGAELDTYIQGFIPTWHLERMSKIAAGVPNETAIADLVVAAPAPTTPAIPEQTNLAIDANTAMWADIEAEQQFAKLAMKFGLLKEDPTKIGTTTL